MSVNETSFEQLQRAHDLIEEAISVLEDLRKQGSRYKASLWFTRAEGHARAAMREIDEGLGGREAVGVETAA